MLICVEYHLKSFEFYGFCLCYPAPSPRGDIEILAYCMLQWLCGRLPWEDNLTNKNQVRDQKDRFTTSLFCHKHTTFCSILLLLTFVLLLFLLFYSFDRYVPRGVLKFKIIQNLVQIISPCSRAGKVSCNKTALSLLVLSAVDSWLTFLIFSNNVFQTAKTFLVRSCHICNVQCFSDHYRLSLLCVLLHIFVIFCHSVLLLLRQILYCVSVSLRNH